MRSQRIDAANRHGSENSRWNWIRVPAEIFTAFAAVLFLLAAGAAQHAQAQTFTVLHNFTSNPDGANPYAGLVRDAAGNLYGTTYYGGSSGVGTVFKIDASGTETVLHSFTVTDGALPYAGLIRDSAGNLYGTTAYGGSSGNGTVFKIDTTGTETVLHTFTGGSDGAAPEAGLIMDSAGNLYGTTLSGGVSYYGTVFKLVPSTGTETVLHSFAGSDGANPYAGLIMDSAGNLYGTTVYGGVSYYGTVFKLVPSTGTETVLYSFSGGSDGAYPQPGLIMDSAGNLFGTTFEGGSSTVGTVFRVVPSTGTETVLHNFAGGSDGDYPYAGLILDSSGNLYGTTSEGGASNGGTVFKLAPSTGTETVLHSFAGGSDGALPYAGLIMDSTSNLYGTASGGGSSGYGTAYKLSLTVPFSAFAAKLDITQGPPPGFQLKADFTLGAGAAAIDPTTQALTLTIGTYSVTIPAGTLQQTKKGWYVFDGAINGVALQIRLSQTGANTYEIQVEGSGVNLTTLANPVPVTLTIGTNTGTTQVDATF